MSIKAKHVSNRTVSEWLESILAVPNCGREFAMDSPGRYGNEQLDADESEDRNT